MSIKYDENIKRPSTKIEYTPEMIKELAECSSNIYKFIKHVKIVHPDKGKIEFSPYSFQKEIIDKYLNNRYIVVKVSRQQGKSVCVGVIALWYSLFNSDKTIGIVSNKESSAKDLLYRIKGMYEDVPYYLKPGVVRWAETSVEFENGTRLLVSATSPDAFRGRSLSLLILDEFAHVNNNSAEAFWASNFPTISASSTARVIVISTPKGMHNLFHKIYTEAERGINGFVYVDANWRAHPDRDQKWADEQKKILGLQQYLQEIECAFIGSDSTLIDPTILEKILLEYNEPKLLELNGRFRIYEKPQEKCSYCLGVDPSKGSGEHNAAIQVLKINSTKPVNIEQVAVFEDNYTDIYQLSEIVYRTAKYYNNAHVMVENNAEGSTVVNQLWWEFEYPNLVNTGTKTINLGIRATRKTKPEAVLLMKKLIEDGSLKIVDKNTLNELTDFVEEGGKFHGKNSTDDLVSALYWGVYILNMQVYDSYEFKKDDNEKEEDIWGILHDPDSEFDWEFNDLLSPIM